MEEPKKNGVIGGSHREGQCYGGRIEGGFETMVICIEDH